MKILAFDFGGTFIKWAVVLIKEKKIINRGNFPTNDNNIELFLKPVFEICSKYIDQIDGVTISSPGSVDKLTGIISGVSAINCIHGPNFKKIFLDKYGIKITIENDANCSLLGECFNGNAKGVSNANLIVIGTGVGGSCLINGKIYNGFKNYGVEFGLMLQHYDDKLTRLSTSCGMYNIVKHFSQKYNQDISGHEIMDMYHEGDQYTVDYMNGVFLQLAIACYNLVQIYNPEIILIGGGISKNEVIIKKINHYYKKIHLEESKEGLLREIMACKNDNDSNLYGAVYNYLVENNMMEKQ